jgi:uncharacterized protein (UPF0332 family)
MLEAERTRRWNMAKENFQAAKVCFENDLYGASVTRSYYAVYQAMWVAVGNPPTGRWRHHGLIHHFCWGQWTQPPSPVTRFAGYLRRLRALYDQRTDADYIALPISRAKAEDGLKLAKEILEIVAQEKGLPFP